MLYKVGFLCIIILIANGVEVIFSVKSPSPVSQ